MQSSTDVLVAGAGPVGLLLACELQRQGVDHMLIDLRPEPSYFCKALGVTPRTLEIFEDLGVVEDAIDAGLWLQGMSTFTNGVESGSWSSALNAMAALSGEAWRSSHSNPGHRAWKPRSRTRPV